MLRGWEVSNLRGKSSVRELKETKYVMKKIYYLSAVSFLFSIIAICLVCIRCKPMTIDLVGLLATIVSVPVAILAVFQAINYFIFEKKMNEKIDTKVEEMKRIIQEEADSLQHTAKSYFLTLSSGEDIVANFNGLLDGYLTALVEDCKGVRKYASNSIIEEIRDIMPRLDEREQSVQKGKKEEYLEVLYSLDYKKTKDIYEFVLKCKEVDFNDEDKNEEDEAEDSSTKID